MKTIFRIFQHACTFIVISALLLVGAVRIFVMGPSSYTGPSSNEGKKIEVIVSDRMFIGDFYTDIEIYDKNGNNEFKWSDPTGQQSKADARKLAKSIRWEANNKVVFDTVKGSVVLIFDNQWTELKPNKAIKATVHSCSLFGKTLAFDTHVSVA